MNRYPALDISSRILLGPGPSMMNEQTLRAMSLPAVGYMDASYLSVMGHLQSALRELFACDYPATFAVTGAGTAAMECVLYNMVEKDESVLCCVQGYFGQRMQAMLERLGAKVIVAEFEWGTPPQKEEIDRLLKEHPEVKVVTVVHGETSTGVVADVAGIAEVVKRHQGYLIVDAVASLGGVEFLTQEWGVDVVYTGGQKCLSGPAGISPVTFSPRAVQKIEGRKTPCSSWYLDLLLVLKYWGENPGYHHTGPIQATFGLYEACRQLLGAGLNKRWELTFKTASLLWQGLEALGLKLAVEKKDRLATLTTVLVPDSLDEATMRRSLMESYSIEIAGGLGKFAGKAWRIGLMGESCQPRWVALLLTSLSTLMRGQGYAQIDNEQLSRVQAQLLSLGCTTDVD